MSRRILIIGGGLAGMAAAVALESAGLAVTLIEARKTLGGRAGSFEDPQTGEILDNCQHVLLGCCTNLIDFYKRLGVEQLIRWEETVHFVDGRGRRFDLRGTRGLPAPLHLASSLLRFKLLTIPQRVALVRAMLVMMRSGLRTQDSGLRFGEWLKEHRQPAELIRKFYDPVLISALNENTLDASAAYAIQVFRESLLAHWAGYRIGLPSCPLGRLYERIPCGDVRLSTRVAELVFDGNRAIGAKLSTGEMINANAVVIAVNHHNLRRWIPDAVAQRDARFARLHELLDVPILGVHLWFDRRVMNQTHAALVDGPLQWLFRKDDTGQSVHGVISAARDWLGRERDESLALFEKQVRSTLPLARDARLLRGVIVIEKRATFSPTPGSDVARPSQAPPAGGAENLFLAGDYTQTNWPATMEGAVRSGYLAAETIAGRRFLVPELPRQWPMRLLS